MAERKFKFHDGKLGAAITVQVTPRSSRNAISEILSDGTIRVSMVNAASGPRANAALVEFLAAVLEVPAEAVEILGPVMERTNTESNPVVSAYFLSTLGTYCAKAGDYGKAVEYQRLAEKMLPQATQLTQARFLIETNRHKSEMMIAGGQQLLIGREQLTLLALGATK